jgi:type 1 fimbriae regulatory protein FimB/type 1 fimbriae regulatory protein FimE
MVAAARQRGRYSVRDALLIMLAYRHGLRASELIALRWDQIDFKAGTLHVNRLKQGSPSTHPIRGPEIRLLHAWQHEQGGDTYVFTSERGGPMTRINVHHVVARAGLAAGIEFPVHPHMLRHATGFYLANAGQDTRAIQLYLGHKNIHSAHGAIYRAESAAIQGFLEGLTPGSGMPHPAPLARQAGFPGAGWDAPPRRRGRGAAGFGSGL